MKVKYMGPLDSIDVGGFGPHKKGEVKEYPDDAAMELVETSKRQIFEIQANEDKKITAKKGKSRKADK